MVQRIFFLNSEPAWSLFHAEPQFFQFRSFSIPRHLFIRAFGVIIWSVAREKIKLRDMTVCR